MPTIEAVLTTTLGNSSWITQVQRIAQEIHKPNDQDMDYIKIALCSAMDHYKNTRFYFNEVDGFRFELIDGQQSYEAGAMMDYVMTGGIFEVGELVFAGPPIDCIKIITAYCLVGGQRWMEMGVTTMEDIRYNTPTDQSTGYPEWYAWFDNAMHLHSIPSVPNAQAIRLDYIQDVGVPTYAWNGTGWSYKNPGGSVLADSWTSPWLNEGQELIRARAKWDLYYNVYHDGENAAMQAEYVGLALRNLRKTSVGHMHKVKRMPIIL